MKVTITGASEGAKLLNNLVTNIKREVLEAMVDAAEDIQQTIQLDALEMDEPDYADSVVVEHDPSSNVVAVGPSIAYAGIKELGERIYVISTRCPWWKYLEPTARERVPSYPRLGRIADRSHGMIKDRILNAIRRLK